MALNIVGISAHYHDSACCLLQNGVLASAVQEERFSRIKNDASVPINAFRYCLDQAGLGISDIDCIAYYENPEKKLSRQLWMASQPEISDDRRSNILRRMNAESPLDELRNLLGYDGPIEILDHHHAHAASSYYYSGFSESAILTVDGVGEWSTTTYGKGVRERLDIIEEVHFPHSIGLLYSTLTAYLGFEVNEGEYKVMGLAPYGSPIYVEKLQSLIDFNNGGQFRLNMNYFEFLKTDKMYSKELEYLLGQPARRSGAELTQFHRDVARSIQVLLEEILMQTVSHLFKIAPSENLCLAGGVALNCVANTRILTEGPFKNLFVQPAAGDAGSALGAAAAAHVRLTGEAPQSERLKHVFLGPAYESDAVHRICAASSVDFQSFAGREDDLVKAVAERIAAGKVIGWVQGRIEFGPRSLGARSILADPRNPKMRNRINSLVKFREGFRPFAPMVLASKMREHFDIDHLSPFMLETCNVVSKLTLPAVTHVDNSARLQTVDQHSPNRLLGLLEEFDRQTGCPVLLNTSFNVKGEPIVCSPEDALLCFVKAQLDCLVIENVLIDKDQIPGFWSMFVMNMEKGRQGIGHDVYTFL